MNKFLLKNRLHDYVDGELSPDERREVEAALPEHPDLMKEIEDIQEQRNSMLEIGQLKAPTNMLDNILMDIETIRKSTSHFLRTTILISFYAYWGNCNIFIL